VSRVSHLLKSVAIVAPLVACGQASAGCWHGLASCSACTSYQAWGVLQPAMAPMVPAFAPAAHVAVYPYQVPVAPASAPAGWGYAGYPYQAPAAVPASPGGMLDNCEGYAEMAPIADYSALVDGRMLAAHIYQNLGKAAQRYGMPVGIEMATIMFQKATRALPTPQEREILERIVARYRSRNEYAPLPNVDDEATETDRRGGGRTVTVVVPPSVDVIRIEIGDGSPRPPRPRPTPPKPKPDPDEDKPNPPEPRPDPDEVKPTPPEPRPSPPEPMPDPDEAPPEEPGPRPKGPGEKVL
jgi:hypothetical protein